MGRFTARFLNILILLAALGLEAQTETNPVLRRRSLPARTGPNALSGHDRADLRREWNLFWFGGKLSPEYMDYKNRLAAEEVLRWRNSFPKPDGTHALTAVLPAPAGTGGGSWTPLGPTANLTPTGWTSIDSGRPVAIVPHPTIATTLYLATSGGGVFKCINADLTAAGDWTWTSITDDLPASGSGGNVSIGAMAISSDGGTLYLGLGDAHDAEGRGFYRSTDGGSTWTAATGLGNATRSYSILPLTATRILWGTNDGLKISNDGGATFAATTGGPATDDVWTVRNFSTSDLICSKSVPDVNGNNTSGVIYSSNDGGATWTLSTISGTTITKGRITLAAANNGSTAYGIVEDRGTSKVARGVLRTTNKGVSWTWMAAPTSTGGLFQGTGPQMTGDGDQGWYNHGLGVDPTNASRLVVGANLALYRSMDGGATWSQLSHWYGSGHVYSHADFHATAWSGGTLWVANDGGLTIVRDPWRPSVPTTAEDLTFIDSRRNKGLSSHLVYNVGSTAATSPADSRWRVTLGLQDNGTRVRQGSGAALQTSGVFEDQIGGDGFGTLIHPVNGDLMLGSIYYTRIYKSINGGATPFDMASTGITESNNSSLAPFAPKLAFGATTAPDTVYTTVNGKVYKSTDFGGNWSGLSTAGLPAGGTNATSDPADALYIRNIGAAAGDPNAIGIAANQGRVYLSYNGGTSWTQGGALPNSASYTSSLCFDRTNSQVAYISSVAPNATKNHLWKTTNGGASWVAIDGSATASNGLPFGIPIHVIQNMPGSPNTLFVGTDFGVYRSTDGGATWARYGSNLPLVAVRDLYIAPDGSFLRAATFGRGVWELVPPVVAGSVNLSPTFAALYTTDTAQFTATVNGGGTVNYTATGGSITGGGLYTAGTTPGTFTVTASNAGDPTQKATADISITVPVPVTFTTQPANQYAAVGRQATFTVVATGSGTLTYQWKKGGVTITGATAASYTTPVLTLSDTGSVYLCEVTGRAGMVASNPATLTVQSLGTAVTASSTTVTAIPDATTGGPGAAVEVPFTVSGITGNTGEVTFSLYLTHTYVGDLDITLVAPDNSTVVLSKNSGNAPTTSPTGAAFGTACGTYLTLSDLGTATIDTQVTPPAIVGTFRPHSALDAFNGKNPNGTWKLRLQDFGPSDVGSFRCGVLSVKPFLGPSLDLNADGVTDLRDLLFFAKYHGTANTTCDLNSDGTVNDADLTILLAGL